MKQQLRSIGVLGCMVGMALATSANAQLSAANSDIPQCITIAPGGTGLTPFPYMVTIRDAANNPVPGATVKITFTTGGDALVAWCKGQAHPNITLPATDVLGQASTTIQGGGCVTTQPCAMPAAVVSATDGVSSFSVNIFCVNSPDRVSTAGGSAACPGTSICVAGATGVGVSDAVAHTTSIMAGVPDMCSKFVPPYGASVGVADAAAVTPYIKAAPTCPC